MEFDGSREHEPSVVEIVLRVSDDRYPVVHISEEVGCTFELMRMLPRGEERYAEFYAVTGGDPVEVYRLAEQEQSVDPRLLSNRNPHSLFEFEVTGSCPVGDLATLDAIPIAAETSDGTGRIEAEIVPPQEPGTVIEEFQDRHPTVSLVEKTDKDGVRPPFDQRELAETLESLLTDRQLEVIREAFLAGYYERPREATGEEVAEQLDISVATFSQHVRVAERRLLGLLFERDGL